MQKEGALPKRKGTIHISEIHVAKTRQVQDGATIGEVGKGCSDEGGNSSTLTDNKFTAPALPALPCK